MVDMAESGISNRFGEILKILSAISFHGDGSSPHNVGVELNAVVKTTEDAANRILSSSETIANMMKEMTQHLLEAEMTNHLGYEKHDRNDSDNSRNGTSSKTLKTSVGEVEISVPRDRKSRFEPKVVKKRETLGTSVEEKII
jgi:transposase-like protein